MKNELTMLKVEHVSKIYKLGEIGGTTLREELQRFNAKLRKKEDPTKKIGAKNYNKGDTFIALNDINFSIKKGERIGIIGHNGAGKSTLLKLISRVTAPTSGTIYMNGRVTSMLEVGTGFHAELTGRENIYLNGAILGMTKKEIDKKIEDIIEFSEVRQFIDTPVKRYSSGMYVKLAFSVAAHLESEIVIMDEVLAVGDMAFQNKCLRKMKDVSINEDRTVLYVSHNMNTIRQLCDRVIVLNAGKIVFDGDTERGISIYLNDKKINDSNIIKTSNLPRLSGCNKKVLIDSIQLLNKKEWFFNRGEPISFSIGCSSFAVEKNIQLRITVKTSSDMSVASFVTPLLEESKIGKFESKISFDSRPFNRGMYSVLLSLFQKDDSGNVVYIDRLSEIIHFSINDSNLPDDNNLWNSITWGAIHLDEIETTTSFFENEKQD